MRKILTKLCLKALLPAVVCLALSTSAFGSLITLNCVPTALTNSFAIGSAISFMGGTGTGSFACSDASLGAVTLNSVTANIFSDYQFGNCVTCIAGEPNSNSAGLTLTDGPDTWAPAHGSPTLPITTMNLTTGVTVFVVGNASSNTDTFTNTKSGGLGGTAYTEPMVDSQTGTLAGIFTLPVTAFVDAGGFASGTSTARVSVTYDYTAVVTAAPEPMTSMLLGSGLLAFGLILRRRKRS